VKTQRLTPKPHLGNPFLEAYLGKPVVLPSSGVNGLKPLPSEDTYMINSANFDLAVHPAYDGLAILREHDSTATVAATSVNATRAFVGASGPNLLAGSQVPLLSDATSVRASSGSVWLAPTFVESNTGALLVPENKGSPELQRHLYKMFPSSGTVDFKFKADMGRTLATGETITIRIAFMDSGLTTVGSASATPVAAGASSFDKTATMAIAPASEWVGLEVVFAIDSPLAMSNVQLAVTGDMNWTANLGTRALFVDRSANVEGVSRGAKTIFSRLCATMTYTGDKLKSGTIASTVLPAQDSGRVLMTYDEITTDTTIRYRTGSVGLGCHLTSAVNNVSQHYFDMARYEQLHPSWASLYFSVNADDPNASFRFRVGSMLHATPTVQYHTVPKLAYVQQQLDEFGTIMSTMPLMMENPSHMKTLAAYVRHALSDAPDYARRLGDIAQAVTTEVIRLKGMAGTLV